MSFRIGEEHVFLGKEIQEPRDFSEGTAPGHRRGSAAAAPRGRPAGLRPAGKQPRPDWIGWSKPCCRRKSCYREEIDEILGPASSRRESSVSENGKANGVAAKHAEAE